MRSSSRCPAFYGEIPPTRWGILDDDGGYFYCITYTIVCSQYDPEGWIERLGDYQLYPTPSWTICSVSRIRSRLTVKSP